MSAMPTVRFCTMLSIVGALVSASVQAAGGDTASSAGLMAHQQRLALAQYALHVAEDAGNYATAPGSIFDTLAILHSGASGGTRTEIGRLTGEGLSPSQVQALRRQLRDDGRPYVFGLDATFAANDRYGVRIEKTWGGGAAEAAELQSGDLLFTIDGQPVRTPDAVRKALDESVGVIKVTGYSVEAGEPFQKRVALTRHPDRSAKKRLQLNNLLLVAKDAGELREEFLCQFERDDQFQFRRCDFHDEETASSLASQFYERALAGTVQAIRPTVDFEPETLMALLNVVTFHAKWADPFPSNRTKPAVFYSPGKQIIADFMHHPQSYFKYGRFAGFKALALPYEKLPMYMLLLLPHEADGLADLEQQICSQPDALAKIAEGMERREVNVSMPQFAVASSGSIRTDLEALGVRRAFTREAEFDSMLGDEEMRLDDVRHHGWLKIDERGTTAAGATTAVGIALAAGDPVEFTADHPFMSLICSEAGAIHFMGRIVRPTPSEQAKKNGDAVAP